MSSSTTPPEHHHHGLLSPGTDIIYLDEDEPLPSPPKVSKGKGKARSLSRIPSNAEASPEVEVVMLYDNDDDDNDGLAEAKQAYLSPPLTAITPSEQFFHSISRALRRGFESIDFDVDLDIHKSDSEAGREDEDEDEDEELRGRRRRDSDSSEELGLNFEQHQKESSVLTPSSPPSDAESSRRATMGDTTRPDDEDDFGPVFPSVRFPSIFTNPEDMSSEGDSSSSSSSVRTASPLLQRDEVEAEVVTVLKELEDIVPIVRRRSRRRRGTWRRRRLVIQEKGLCAWFFFCFSKEGWRSEAFFLI